MTREQKLWSMTMKMLVVEAEKINVKVDKKGSRAKAIEKILAAEAKMAEVEPEVVEEEKCGDGTEYPEVMQEIIAGAEKKAEAAKAEKKERKPRQPKHTFEALLMDIPLVADLQISANSKRNAVHVKRGDKRIFGYSGKVIVVSDEKYLTGIDYEARNYGYRVAPTRENMVAILKNAAAV